MNPRKLNAGRGRQKSITCAGLRSANRKRVRIQQLRIFVRRSGRSSLDGHGHGHGRGPVLHQMSEAVHQAPRLAPHMRRHGPS
jgi:hypothetical protein